MTATTDRPVRVHLAMRDDSLSRSIRKLLPITGNEKSHTYVNTQDEADLIIFTDVRNIEREYTKEKSYAYFVTPGFSRASQLPDNCMTIEAPRIMQDLINAINGARKNLKPIAGAPVATETETTPLHSDALRILVVEDTPKHRASASVGLAGHKLTVATGYEVAMKVLADEKFDVVLTDLQMPMSSQTLGPDAFKLGQLVPYGILLMIEAAHRGAKHVAVVTDLNHHADWVSAAFDHFGYPVQIEGAKVLMMHSPMNSDGSKDWAEALNKLMKD